VLELERDGRGEAGVMTGDSDVLVEVRGLKKHFPVRAGLLSRKRVLVRAVDGVSFTIRRGRTLGLVGESGSGKTTVGRTLLRLIEPTDGTILIEGEDFRAVEGARLRRMRRRLQMVFQDPNASLNPRMKIEDLIAEPLEVQGGMSRGDVRRRVGELMELVGLPNQYLGRYAHEFSGGQRQRIGIARALALDPDLIVCDEAIASLDVSIQAQIINLLEDLQKRLGLTYLFIAHDLSMVRHISDDIAVMYLGRLMELADRKALYETPQHPYTQALISAVPVPDPDLEALRRRVILEGDIPSPSNPPPGCVFSTRCRYARKICFEQVPEYREIRPAHHVACHFAGDLPAAEPAQATS
jgi:oligopeptide transport system ATP-binding protein